MMAQLVDRNVRPADALAQWCVGCPALRRHRHGVVRGVMFSRVRNITMRMLRCCLYEVWPGFRKFSQE